MPFERIVAATDFSAASARALRRAALLGSVAANVALMVQTDVLRVRENYAGRRAQS